MPSSVKNDLTSIELGIYLKVLETTRVQMVMNIYSNKHSARLGNVDKHKLVTQVQLVGMLVLGRKYCLFTFQLRVCNWFDQ